MTVCVTESSFRTVTTVPGATLRLVGWNAKFLMTIVSAPAVVPALADALPVAVGVPELPPQAVRTRTTRNPASGARLKLLHSVAVILQRAWTIRAR